MRWVRIALVALVGASLAAGWWWGPRHSDPGEELPLAGEGPYLICGGPLAGGGLAARVGVYTDELASISVAAVGVREATATLQPAGLGGAGIDVADLAELGATPVLVEGSGSLAAAVASHSSEAALLSTCLRASPDPAGMVGMDTSGGQTSTLHFVNPFAQDAILSLEITSELGTDTPGDLESIRVPAGTHVEVPLTRVLSGRQAVSVIVEPTAGLAGAAAVRSSGADLASVEARSGSLDWNFPLPAVALGGEIHLLSVSDLVGDFRLDRVEPAGITEGVVEGTINPGEQIVVSLAEVLSSPGGLKVVATEPLVAGLVLESGSVRAVMTGGPESTRWVAPVTVPAALGVSALWVLNLAADPASISFSPLDGNAVIAPVELGPGSVAEVVLPDLGSGGVLIEADQPIVVALAVTQGGALATTLASPIE